MTRVLTVVSLRIFFFINLFLLVCFPMKRYFIIQNKKNNIILKEICLIHSALPSMYLYFITTDYTNIFSYVPGTVSTGIHGEKGSVIIQY